MKKIKFIIIIILISLLTTGCWDMIEINQRIFPYSIGVDKDGEAGKFIVTISYPNINAIGKNANQEDRIFIVSTNADSVFEGAKELSTRLPYPFYFKHLRVLVFGEELAKDSKVVREILDGMARDFVINKKISLLVAEGRAEDLLKFKLKAKRQEVIEGALVSMLSKDKDIATYTNQTLSKFIKDTDLNNVALVPKAKHSEDDIKMYGGCIFKDYAYIGHLNEKQNRVVDIITKGEDKALLDIPFEDTTISFDLTGTKVEKKLIEEKGNIKMKFNIEMEGRLQEYTLQENSNGANQDFIEKIEDNIAKQFEKEVRDTVDVLQNKYKADALGIGEYIQKFHPRVWKKIGEDWDEIFPQMDIECNIDAKLRRRGLLLTR